MKLPELRVSGEAVSELLDGAGDFLEVARVLRGLTEAQAFAKIPGYKYSISQISAHIRYWQHAKLSRAKGSPISHQVTNEETFRVVETGGWEPLVAEIVAGVEEVRAFAMLHAEEAMPEDPETSVGFHLARCASHTGYHLGQIVMLRRMMGLWNLEPDDDEDYF